jgi:hypothetical protein
LGVADHVRGALLALGPVGISLRLFDFVTSVAKRYKNRIRENAGIRRVHDSAPTTAFHYPLLEN